MTHTHKNTNTPANTNCNANTNSKKKVALVFGGKSVEHEVSWRSANSIRKALNREQFELILLGVDKNGCWHLLGESALEQFAENPQLFQWSSAPQVLFKAGQSTAPFLVMKDPQTFSTLEVLAVDVVFPIIHGTYGEDGTLQGILKSCHLPFVGANVAASAVGMDKVLMKQILEANKIAVAPYQVLYSSTYQNTSYESLVKDLGSPFFIKPANAGSSVGVHKIKTVGDYLPALKDAFQYDTKVLAEQFIQGRELECSVLGNENLRASLAGEVIPQHDFYSYEAKYLDSNGANLQIPAQLTATVLKNIQHTAIQTARVLGVEGFARVDFFLRGENELLINEINTLPGFTAISMYPKMWEASGLKYSELITELINLGLQRFERDSKLATHFVLPQ